MYIFSFLSYLVYMRNYVISHSINYSDFIFYQEISEIDRLRNMVILLFFTMHQPHLLNETINMFRIFEYGL